MSLRKAHELCVRRQLIVDGLTAATSETQKTTQTLRSQGSRHKAAT